MNRFLTFILTALLAAACGTPTIQEAQKNESGKPIIIKYAKGFSIEDFGDYFEIQVNKPYPGATEPLRYILRRSGQLERNEIAIPISSLVCTSTTHLPLIELLQEVESLKGFPGIKYISSETFIKQSELGKLMELGVDTQINIEAVLELNPNILMAFSMGSESRQLSKLAEMGVPVVFNGDYLEESVLGRAEWIKFMAAFYGKLDMADSIFSALENEYLALQQLTKNLDHRPSVMSGLMYGDAWYMPGGTNWGAALIEHAGGDYIWSDDPSSGWIEVGFESVIDKARNADYWIGVASLASLSELANADDRYRNFAPFKNQKVYNYTAKVGPGGGYAIMESGYAMPQTVLADMIKILHPELLPDHKLYFYEQLP